MKKLIIVLLLVTVVGITPVQGWQRQQIDIFHSDYKEWNNKIQYYTPVTIDTSLWWADRTEAAEYPTVYDPTIGIYVWGDWDDPYWENYWFRLTLYYGYSWDDRTEYAYMYEGFYYAGGDVSKEWNLHELYDWLTTYDNNLYISFAETYYVQLLH